MNAFRETASLTDERTDERDSLGLFSANRRETKNRKKIQKTSFLGISKIVQVLGEGGHKVSQKGKKWIFLKNIQFSIPS